MCEGVSNCKKCGNRWSTVSRGYSVAALLLKVTYGSSSSSQAYSNRVIAAVGELHPALTRKYSPRCPPIPILSHFHTIL